MTQGIAGLTPEAVYLASDRKLTEQLPNGQLRLVDDMTCKLVNFRDLCGITYTGWAYIEGVPTHEWIARHLLRMPPEAQTTAIGELLQKAANEAWRQDGRRPLKQTFLVAGWALEERRGDSVVLAPFFELLSNGVDEEYRSIAPTAQFNRCAFRIKKPRPCEVVSVGVPLNEGRRFKLKRFGLNAYRRKASPRYFMRTIVREIVNTSKNSGAVGYRVLCCCYPM